MNFPETAMRIKKALEINDMNAQTLAEKSGVAKASISHYVNGRNEPSNISALKMGKVLGVNPMWLMGYDVPMFGNPIQSPEHSQFKLFAEGSSPTRVPVYASVSAGNGCFADGNIESYVEIPEEMARKGEFFGLRVRGDSMEPDIKDGDIIIVRSQDTAADESVVVAVVNGDEGFCKRLAMYADGLSLVSNNPAYKPKYYSADQVRDLPVKILGVVERLIRDF